MVSYTYPFSGFLTPPLSRNPASKLVRECVPSYHMLRHTCIRTYRPCTRVSSIFICCTTTIIGLTQVQDETNKKRHACQTYMFQQPCSCLVTWFPPRPDCSTGPEPYNLNLDTQKLTSIPQTRAPWIFDQPIASWLGGCVVMRLQPLHVSYFKRSGCTRF